MNVVTVKPNPKKPENGFVTFDDGSEAWTPDPKLAEPFIGKPLPSDWTLKDGPYGKQALPPKDGKGTAKAAYANTKEGMAYVQERMDRRTALMQAVLVRGPEQAEWDVTAERMFKWLRSTVEEPKVDTQSRAKPSVAPEHAATDAEWGAKPGNGEVAGKAPCSHPENSNLKPDGSDLPDGFIRCTTCGLTRKASE